MQAQGLLEEINLDDAHLPWFLKILTLKNLAELLLLEIESEDNPALFIEVEQIIDQIVDVAKIQNLLALNVEALILQSKLKLVQGSTIEAKDYLDQAEEFSRKYNLAHMIQLVQDKQKQFDLNFKKWSDLTNSSQSLKERMQEIQLKHYMDLAMELRSTIDDI